MGLLCWERPQQISYFGLYGVFSERGMRVLAVGGPLGPLTPPLGGAVMLRATPLGLGLGSSSDFVSYGNSFLPGHP
eukprot:1385686-Amorphochlora_amoeboformis.AAC.1